MAVKLPSNRDHKSKATDLQTQDLVRLNIEIPSKLRKELKQFCTNNDTSMRELVTGILTLSMKDKHKLSLIQ